MPTPAADDEPPPPPKTRWKRYKLPVNRKDRAVRSAPHSDGEPGAKRTSGRTVVIVLGMVLAVAFIISLLMVALCAGLRF